MRSRCSEYQLAVEALPVRRQSVRFILREATSAFHQRVDDLFAVADLRGRSGYADFLSAQAAAHLPVEQALERADVARVLSDWPERRRSHLLAKDLEVLGESIPPPIDTVEFEGAPALLGAAYVLEGSRLGGALLRQSVAPDLPTAFLSASDPSGWRRLVAVLEDQLTTQAATDQAIEAARAVFALFELSGQRLNADKDSSLG